MAVKRDLDMTEGRTGHREILAIMKNGHMVYYNTEARKPWQENAAATCSFVWHFVCQQAFLPNSTVLFVVLASFKLLAACHST